MPIRICVLGNSHAAALKHAWDSNSGSFPGARFCFHGMVTELWWRAQALPGGLQVVDPEEGERGGPFLANGRVAIEFSDFDVFVVCGLFRFHDFYSSRRHGSSWNPPASPAGVGHTAPADSSWLAKTPAGHLLRLLGASGKPVYLLPAPMCQRDIVEADFGQTVRPYSHAVDEHGAPDARTLAILGAWRALQRDTRILLQPASTLEPGGLFTQAGYSRRIELPASAKKDYGHANTVYGLRMIRRILAACRRDRRPRNTSFPEDRMGRPHLRVCIIGNSHLAALRAAHDGFAAAHPELELAYYGIGQRHWMDVRLEGREFVSDSPVVRKMFRFTSGIGESLPLDAFDIFVVYGTLAFVDYMKTIRWRRFENRGENAVSQSAKELSPEESWMDVTPAGRVIAMLDSVGKPWVCMPAPMKLEKVYQVPAEQVPGHFAQLRDESGRTRPVIRAIVRAWHERMSRLPFVSQPPDTLAVDGLCTAARFQTEHPQEGAVDSAAPDGEDFTHMNGAFGRLVLERLYPAVKEAWARHASPPATTGRQRTGRSGPQPYSGLPARCFWNRTVAERQPRQITDWYQRKFDIGESVIATAGSCFAQHIGRHLRNSGFRFLDTEPAPADLAPAIHADHGYGLYSARFGNVYTTRQLLQLFDRAFGEFVPHEDCWPRDGGFVDPFRPTIQPVAFPSVDDVVHARELHLAAVRRMFGQAGVFVFTLGLTEAWISREDGAVYPVAPGVSGGAYDETRHAFANFRFAEVYADLRRFMDKARDVRKDMRFLLTVSPVPLMATASGQQVVVATSGSKAVLRAVAGQLAEELEYVDYFPSYEIVAATPMRGAFYGKDKRGVLPEGVDFVMQQFFSEHAPPGLADNVSPEPDEASRCDEELLAAFGKPG